MCRTVVEEKNDVRVQKMTPRAATTSTREATATECVCDETRAKIVLREL